MTAIRFEPTSYELSKVIATLIAGGYEEQICYYDIEDYNWLDYVCPECDNKGYVEIFDEDLFCPIEMVWVFGTLEYQEYPCNCYKGVEYEPYLGNKLRLLLQKNGARFARSWDTPNTWMMVSQSSR